MASTQERDAILEHALLNEDNLSVAIKIGMAFEELCDRVIAGFVGEIEKQLCSRLGKEWRVENVLKRRGTLDGEILSVKVLPDADGTYVTLANEKVRPASLYWALRSANQSAIQPAKAEQLKKAIDAQYAQGNSSEWSLWYRYLDKRYGDWTREDVLLKLYSKDATLDYFVEHMAKIAQVVGETVRRTKSVKNKGPKVARMQ